MFKIKNENMHILTPLLNENNSHYPFLKSIIFNKKKGVAYVDSLDNPCISAIISNNGWFYLLGESTNEVFNTKLEQFILKKVIVDKIPILWFGISREWKMKLIDLTSVVVRDYPRIQYKFIGTNYKRNSLNNDKYK